MYDFGFGECIAVRSVLEGMYRPSTTSDRGILSLKDMGYLPSTMDGLLADQTKSLILSQTGLSYNRVIMTAGASNAICSLLRVLKSKMLFDSLYYRAPFFGYYPKFANRVGINVLQAPGTISTNWVDLVDSPSNPSGVLRGTAFPSAPFVIWDAVYNNDVYSSAPFLFPSHDAMIGSYGKLLGINGVRVGWVALNDHLIADLLAKEVYEETLGVSTPSQRLVSSILDTVNIESFMAKAKANVDANRERMVSLEYLADVGEVPDNGMFYWAKMSKKAQDLLTKANVVWIKGGSCGSDDSYVRLNLAQDVTVTKNMVNSVTSADRRKI